MQNLEVAQPKLAALAKPLSVPKTGNTDRDRLRELFAQALQLALPDVPDGDPGGIAAEIEEGTGLIGLLW